VGSKTFDGIRFSAYADDHLPAHVHGKYAETEVLVELLPGGKVIQSGRNDAVRPIDAKRSDVRRILSMAALHATELHDIWEKVHGSAS
jgi:hypothetical protein